MTFPMKRGERMARQMLQNVRTAGLRVRFLKIDSEWAIEMLNPKPLTDEELRAATDLTMFAIGYPRNFGTLVRLHEEQGVGQ